MVVQVEDTGPGIPEDEREQVFQPFYRALGTDVDGSGLGLAIVKEIADQHGATVATADAPASQAHGEQRAVALKGHPRPTPRIRACRREAPHATHADERRLH